GFTRLLAATLPQDRVEASSSTTIDQDAPSPTLGWHLEEIDVTWAHLDKKRTRLQTYTKSLKKYCLQNVETALQA
ncbi:hypothetical protein Tco_0091406, partial [Tanacetum coccineum]